MVLKKDTSKEDIEAVPSFALETVDPLVVRPVELPLVVKPANGASWKNNEQAEYAKILNAAAYARPEQWTKNQINESTGAEIPNSSTKDIELKRLVEIGDNPARYYVYTGSTPMDKNLTYNDKRLA